MKLSFFALAVLAFSLTSQAQPDPGIQIASQAEKQAAQQAQLNTERAMADM